MINFIKRIIAIKFKNIKRYGEKTCKIFENDFICLFFG